MPVIVQEGHEEYFCRFFSAVHHGEPIPHAQLSENTVNGYLDMVNGDRSNRLVCAEVPQVMIGKVEARYQPPEYCRGPNGELDDFKPMLWLGGAGNFTHLHYDGDYRHVLQYQLWGRKRVVLLPVTASKKLGPIRNNSVMSPEGMTEEESDRFVRYCDGWQAVVGTGETLLIPAAMWHYFEYLDTSMALTMRFARNKYTATFAENCHMDYHLQALVTRFIDERAVDDQRLRAYAEINDVLKMPMDSPLARGALMQQTYERLYAELCGDSLQGTLARPFLKEFSDTVRRADIAIGQLYQGQVRQLS
jgi:hypothetical protein